LSVCLPVCLSVCPVTRQQPQRAAGLLLGAVRAGDIDRQWQAPGAQQQWRRRAVLSSKCGRCLVFSRRRKLDADTYCRAASQSCGSSLFIRMPIFIILTEEKMA